MRNLREHASKVGCFWSKWPISPGFDTELTHFRTIVLCLGLAVLVALWFGLGRFLRLDLLLLHIDDFANFVASHAVLAGLAYVTAYAVSVALSLPIALALTLIGGTLFGGLVGTALTAVGATLGACALFLAARGMFHDYFAQKTAGWLARLRSQFNADAASYLLLLRLTPVFPFAIVNLAAALLGTPFRTYLWTTFFGILPGTLAYSMTGAGLGGVLTGEAARLAACHKAGGADCRAMLDLSALISREVVLGLAALAVVMVVSIAARRLLQRNRTSE